MYLKALELQGFKSFPDKISLTFGKGMTAVVGPNGSGKSNIGDAVRWVLGEQSTKNLRGTKMEDIIFSGTSSRRQVGFAAVTLTIDNSDHTLTDQPETVTVTRKLYRSGDSEYAINGKMVRLKDVNELFMDTGLGRDGYSIIGQGRIAEIVGAKSAERRSIFEEAAGVSKFRYRKEEAQRKLKAAQDNILRLQDIVAELEDRIGPLRIQAEKAEKYLVLAKERRSLEISLWCIKLTDLKEKLKNLEDEALVITANYEHLEADIQREEEKINQAYSEMQRSTLRVESLRKNLLELEQENGNQNAKVAVLENEIAHCERDMELLQQNLKEESEKHEDCQKNLEMQQRIVTDLKQQNQSITIEMNELKQKSDDLNRENSSSDATITKLREELSALYQEKYRLKLELENTQKQQNELQMREQEWNMGKQEQEAKLSELREEENKIQTELKKAEETLTELTHKGQGYQNLLAQKNEKLSKSKESYQAVYEQIREKQNREKILADLERNMDGLGHSVRQILKASQSGVISGIHGTVAQLIGVDKEYGTAIETTLGNSMQFLVTTDENVAKNGINYLKQKKGGRATFLPLSSIKGNRLKEAEQLQAEEGFLAVASDLIRCEKSYRNIVENLLGRTAVVENLDYGTRIAKKYAYRFRIVTLDGQLINAGGSYTGGSAVQGSGMITRKNELDSLKYQLAELAEEQKNQQQLMNKIQEECNQLSYQLEACKEEYTQANAEKIRLETALSGAKNLTAQAGTLQMEREKQFENLQTEQESLKNLLAELRRSQENNNKELDEKEKISANAEGKQQDLSQRWQKIKDQLAQKQMEQMNCDSDLRIAEMALQNLKNELGTSEIRKREYQEKWNHSLADKEKYLAEQEQGKAKLLENEAKSVQIQDEIKIAQSTHNTQEKYVNDLRDGMKGLQKEQEKASVEKIRMEERQIGVQKEYDGIILQLTESYELTRSEAMQEAVEIAEPQKAQYRLSELKSKIRGLGSVNVDAVEEYREVSERYRYMTAQMSDVTKSKQELETLIDSLTKDMCSLFTESFAIINRNFGEIFTDLFGGGKAELTLTDPDHVLESGIEIHVAPPGKVIKNLISLSGGEQTFVAICIYFAILRYRPAPFCILDEIDAALDEANVRSYAQYLKHFTKHTQFVVVTHRRGAMEQADVLYGVTMQKDGISRLLRLDLKEAISEAEN